MIGLSSGFKCSENNLFCTDLCKFNACENGGNDVEKDICAESDDDEKKIEAIKIIFEH